MREINIDEIERIATGMFRRAATTFTPDRAILLECVLEAEPEPPVSGFAAVAIDRFKRCAEKGEPLFENPSGIVIFAEVGTECFGGNIIDACIKGAECAGLSGLETDTYVTEIPGDSLKITVAVLSEPPGTADAETSLLPGEIARDKFAAELIKAATGDKPLYFAGIGLADSLETARALAVKAALRTVDGAHCDKALIQTEKSVAARVNNSLKNQRKIVSVSIEQSGAGFISALTLECLVNPVTCVI